MPLRPISDREALATVSPTPTPLLDEALVRAEAVKRAAVSEPPRPGLGDGAQVVKVRLPEPKPAAEQAPLQADPEPAGSTVEPDPGTSGSADSENAPEPDPKAVWGEAIERMRSIAHERAGASEPDARSWAVRERLLDGLALAADDEHAKFAVAPIWQSLVEALAAAGPAPGGPESALRRAARELEARAPLEITDLRLCRKVDGYGGYEAIEPAAVKPGQPVIVYCEVAGLRYEAVGESYRSRVESRVEILPADGIQVRWSQPLGVAEDTCRRPRRDYYINFRLRLPDTLPKGAHQLRLVQKDLLSGRECSSSLDISID
jgi:hypothetical protein